MTTAHRHGGVDWPPESRCPICDLETALLDARQRAEKAEVEVEQLRSAVHDATARTPEERQRRYTTESLCADIRWLARQRIEARRRWSTAEVEVARLQAGGCARDQNTTQYCAEAVVAKREAARWQELSRENSVRATEAEAREDRLRAEVAALRAAHCSGAAAVERLRGALEVIAASPDWPASRLRVIAMQALEGDQ